MIEFIMTPFVMLCILVIFALFVGIKIGEDNERNKDRFNRIYRQQESRNKWLK